MDFRDAFVLWRGLDIDYTGGVLANPARDRHSRDASNRRPGLGLDLDLCRRDHLLARAQSRALKVAGGLLVGAVLLQIGIGVEHGAFWDAAWRLATLHNAGAALLVICTVTLLRLLWPEPARSA